MKKYFPVFVLPTLISFIVVFLIPFILGIYLSFTRFTTVESAEWVGFDNYIKAFTRDENFLNALWFTVKFTVISVITINVFAFLLAIDSKQCYNIKRCRMHIFNIRKES